MGIRIGFFYTAASLSGAFGGNLCSPIILLSVNKLTVDLNRSPRKGSVRPWLSWRTRAVALDFHHRGSLCKLSPTQNCTFEHSLITVTEDRFDRHRSLVHSTKRSRNSQVAFARAAGILASKEASAIQQRWVSNIMPLSTYISLFSAIWSL